MLFLIALFLAIACTWYLGSIFKKHPIPFYVMAICIAAVAVLLANIRFSSSPVWVTTYVFGLFTRGAFATALWCIVMWTGALKNGSALMKRYMPIRGELSIFAAILTLGHNIGFCITYFVRMFTNSMGMRANQTAAGYLSILMLLIMIPLTILSFPAIRRKMKPKRWKQVQRFAYLFYAMLYLHVMLLYYPYVKAGRSGYLFTVLLYSAVFLGYAVCRVRKQLLLKRKLTRTLGLNAVSACVFAVLFCAAAWILHPTEHNNPVISAEAGITAPAATTTIRTTLETNAATTTSVTTTALFEITDEASTTASNETSSTGEETTSFLQTEETDAFTSNVILDPMESQTISTTLPSTTPASTDTVSTTSISHRYRNGSFTASSYGYDGDITVTVTIQNDVITNISASSEESDLWYFESAESSVIAQILNQQNPSVDAVSGATYSSNGIMDAVRRALQLAQN